MMIMRNCNAFARPRMLHRSYLLASSAFETTTGKLKATVRIAMITRVREHFYTNHMESLTNLQRRCLRRTYRLQLRSGNADPQPNRSPELFQLWWHDCKHICHCHGHAIWKPGVTCEFGSVGSLSSKCVAREFELGSGGDGRRCTYADWCCDRSGCVGTCFWSLVAASSNRGSRDRKG